MYSLAFSILFVAFLIVTLLLRFWLASRHIRHVLRNRGAVPAEFADKIPLAAHQKAADYTVAKTKFGLLTLGFNSFILIGFTLLGGLQWLSQNVYQLSGPGMAYQIALLVAFAAVSGLIDLPFDYYKQFVLEQRFGFNQMTRALFFADAGKGALVGAAIGLPLIWVVLSLMGQTGDLWWLYAWLVWSGFSS